MYVLFYMTHWFVPLSMPDSIALPGFIRDVLLTIPAPGKVTPMDKKIYLSIMAALATVVAIWLFALRAPPIAKPLTLALIIGIATLPHHDRLARRIPGHPDLSAGLMVFAITVCFILPVAGLIAMVVQNAADWYTEGERLLLAF